MVVQILSKVVGIKTPASDLHFLDLFLHAYFSFKMTLYLLTSEPVSKNA